MIVSQQIWVFILGSSLVVTISGCNHSTKQLEPTEKSYTTEREVELENEAWQMEVRYWDYVQNIDTIAYKRLWHDDFLGYPSFGDSVSNKRKIANWIPELHKDPNLKFSYTLHRKATNAIDDVVMVFYDADEIWTDKDSNVVRKETFKFIHTWKKYDDHWLILGGMAAAKNQENLID